MIPYNAPVEDMKFLFNDLGMLDEINTLPGCEDTDGALIHALLGEAGKLATEVLAPINTSGDRQGVSFDNGTVRSADGFRDAYQIYVEGGWNALPFQPEYGGQGVPWLISTAVQEMLSSANLSWSLCPLLTTGVIEALIHHGSDEQQALYLPKLVSGEWSGTMNLTEPHAGSDLGEMRCRAEPEGDHYRIKGQKIFITWGEHDMADNIIHMVLARLPDAPPGTRGISLFLIPRILVNPDGSLGEHNDVRCLSIEHKLGIHASPTCTMGYGEDGEGAIGYLVGTPHQGLSAMFTMMNLARFSVGLEGIAIAERAYQQARNYARDRVQGTLDGGGPEKVAIIHHPDVRRMLMTMKAGIEAMRALAYDTAVRFDFAQRHPDDAARRDAQSLLDLMTPVVKAWSSDFGVELSSIAVQVHGGMGFIEETGVAQHMRDARITSIYEGTNGIQARDLVGRKILRDQGETVNLQIARFRSTAEDLAGTEGCESIKHNLDAGIDALEKATAWLVDTRANTPDQALAGATPYLRLLGTVAGGIMMARTAVAAQKALATPNGREAFYRAKLETARFYACNILPQASALADAVTEGAESVLAIPAESF